MGSLIVASKGKLRELHKPASTMKLLGIARNGSLVLFQAARGAEALAPRQLGGHAASTCAFVIYTLLRLGYFGGGGGGGGAAKQKAQ